MKHTLNKHNFYSFVCSALNNEASRENRAFFLEYFLNNKMYDACFPDGFMFLDYPGKRKLLIDIDYSFNYEKYDSVISRLREQNPECFYICITYSNITEMDLDYRLNARVLGRDFIYELIERNNEIYLAAVLSSPKETLNSDFEYKDDVNREKTNLYITSNNDKLYISEEDPEKLSNTFENDFKAYLNSNNRDKCNCALIVGNGASIPFGSDSWSDMIDNLSKYLEPFFVENSQKVKNALSNSSYAISSFVKNTLERNGLRDKYIDAIYYCIYRRYNALMHDRPSMIKALTRAKIKFPALPLLTYNYDTFIEMQYKHETGNDLICSSSDYYDYDIGFFPRDNVIHLHGYLNYLNRENLGLVLTDEEYFDAYLNNSRSWAYKTQISALRKYKCLFVDSSMSDLFQMSVISKARRGKGDDKWNCFALMCLKDLSLREKMEIIKYYLEKGIKIIFVTSFEDLPIKLSNLFNIVL